LIKKKKSTAPETKQILSELEEVVERLGFKLRYEKGNFEGGYCLLKELRLFVINSRNEPERRIGIIARNLKELGIDEIFVKPHLREIIEKESKKKNKKENEEE
jgi:Zn-dependent peptidase ImmA (M78 family)